MNEDLDPSQQLITIRKMMERSSRFISLSGLSGISAGICALIGAYIARPFVQGTKNNFININEQGDYNNVCNYWIFYIALATFVTAFISAFLFTFIKSKKQGIPVWGVTSKKLMFHVALPMIVGAVFIFKIISSQAYDLITPACLIFYGLGLINASRYTLQEIKYLGYFQLFLGIINLACTNYGLELWATGFGFLHIVYGYFMWNKYDRNPVAKHKSVA